MPSNGAYRPNVYKSGKEGCSYSALPSIGPKFFWINPKSFALFKNFSYWQIFFRRTYSLIMSTNAQYEKDCSLIYQVSILMCRIDVHASLFPAKFVPLFRYNLKSDWKRMSLFKWPSYDYFWPFFCHLYVHLSQNWVSDGHFEVFNQSKSQLVQKSWPQM